MAPGRDEPKAPGHYELKASGHDELKASGHDEPKASGDGGRPQGASVQNGNFIPGGSCSPPVTFCISACEAASILSFAARWAATIRSCNISVSAGSTTFGSIVRLRISPLPFNVTRT